MREFKNPKAIELMQEAQAIEDYVASKEYELVEKNLPWPEYYSELLTEASGLRVLADDVEDGIISAEEV